MNKSLIALFLLVALIREGSGYTLSDSNFTVLTGEYGEISSLKLKGDAFPTEYVFNATSNPALDGANHQWLGELIFTYRLGNGPWIKASTNQSTDVRQQSQSGSTVTVSYESSANSGGIRNFRLVESYSLKAGYFHWQITVTNTGTQALEFGDFGLPLPFNQRFPGGELIYESRVLQPGFIGNNSSFVHVQRPSGVGPFLLMVPDASTGAGFEYQDFGAVRVYYIHSNVIKSTNRGYLPNTSLILQPGQSKEYAFKFFKVRNRDEMAAKIFDEGLIDISVVPGMVVATNLTAKFDLHTTKPIKSVTAQFPEETSISPFGAATANHNIYQATFRRLGQNNVYVEYGNGEKTALQFYVTEPFDKAVQRHATFMVEKQQIQAPGQLIDKIFDDWLMDTRATRKKWYGYWGWGDDWGLTHGQFLAEKNVHDPVASEVKALDEYLEVAIWTNLMDGHHQDYLVHDFIQVPPPNTTPTYRGYAYVHVYNTYFAMYNIAKLHPDIIGFVHDSKTYLLRAYNIYKAQYGPGVFYNWETGQMGEQTTPDIIAALDSEGLTQEANWIRATMTTKYNRFRSNKYPYGSEFAFDNTGEEAGYMLAKMKKNTGMMETIVTKSIGCRGLAPEWYHYSDPGTQSGDWNQRYATSLTGAALFDWAMNHSKTPEKDLRLAYASKTANFSSINSGQINADPANIGTSAWCYQRMKGSRYSYVDGGNLHNGWWQMSGESDLALWGALRIISSDVAVDPVFGLTCYGCEVSEGVHYTVVPKDGLFKRLNMVSLKLSLILEQDQYASAIIGKAKNHVQFTLRNRKTSAHTTKLSVTGLAAGSYDVRVDGSVTGAFTVSSDTTTAILLNIGVAPSYDIAIVPKGTNGIRAGKNIGIPHHVGVRAGYNGIHIDYHPSFATSNPPSLTVTDSRGGLVGYRESVPAGPSVWRPATGAPLNGVYFVRLSWPEGGSVLRKVSVVK